MKHQYKTELLWKKIAQKLIDFFVDAYVMLFIKIEKPNNYSEPDKILFIVLAQLGDALVMSYIFPFIRERFPNSKIDVLAGEWVKPILENNPYINKIIYFNHFRMNRMKLSIWRKIKNHIISSKSALKFIQREQYDLSIEGGVTHPNGNIITYRGNVKRRIGFGSGGFGSLLTDEVKFPDRKNFHILEAILQELHIVGINNSLSDIKPYFFTQKNSKDLERSIYNKIKPRNSYLIIHPESGNSKRMMTNIFWSEITQRIIRLTKHDIIICGIFNESSALTDSLLSNIPGSKNRIINAVQKLSLEEFYLLNQKSSAAITVDSLASHFCSINANTLSFFKNGYGRYFCPIPNLSVTVIHNHLPSRESFNTPNCNSIYVQNFESNETYAIVEKFLVELTKNQT